MLGILGSADERLIDTHSKGGGDVHYRITRCQRRRPYRPGQHRRRTDATTLYLRPDGATQVFTPDGRTVYTDNGAQSSGEWKVDDDGRFQSFWPPSYYATYDVSWIAGPDGDAVGIRFADANRGTAFDGRYTPGLA